MESSYRWCINGPESDFLGLKRRALEALRSVSKNGTSLRAQTIRPQDLVRGPALAWEDWVWGIRGGLMRGPADSDFALPEMERGTVSGGSKLTLSGHIAIVQRSTFVHGAG